MTIEAEHLVQWEAGQLPSLERWPRLSQVYVWLRPSQERDLFHMLTLPFLGLSASTRQRIRGFQVHQEALDVSDGSFEAAMPHLALLLPNLEELDLSCTVVFLSTSPASRRQLCDGIKALSRLQTLKLPNCSDLLPLLGELAGSSLRHLEVSIEVDDEPWLQQQLLQLLRQLTQLQSLSIRFTSGDEAADIGAGSLPVLLDGLPPALVHLRELQALWDRRAGCYADGLEAELGLLRHLMGLGEQLVIRMLQARYVNRQ
ncbi:hypothetical protein GPECTOR_9g659 [Gonium pectorale]|uniref:Uncharacterized protein n=1 Tax=Gonium pectorale TaxID=33097 RepID=A0A150GS64_GONPE|nr:hypothetical protein GPECTOR_9g659 [Gonium pectorale]|eukprot:KXZ52614.1 hypothetical protein GPECTOR_9g659 [Gonium pectorale]